jgi:hypothetical protein
MAVDPKKRQKKLQRKAHKRKQKVGGKQKARGKGLQPQSYVEHPVLECLMGESIDEVGMGSVLIARETPYAEVAVSAFVVDVWCLGVKEAFFTVMRKADYLSKLKPMLTKTHEEHGIRGVEPACARKLLQGAVVFGEELGFEPAEDYWRAEKLFGDADASQCEAQFRYGREGKPCYVQGPNDDIKVVRYVLERLNENVGEGNFDYLVEVEGQRQASRPELETLWD